MVAVIAFLPVAGFAADEKPAGSQFTFGLTGQAYGAAYRSVFPNVADGSAVTGSFCEMRIRPEFGLSNGDTKFKLRLEYDGSYGEKFYKYDGSANNGQETKVSGDTKNVEVAQAYFETKVTALSGLMVTAGLAPTTKIPFFFSDNAPLFALAYEMGAATVRLSYIKVNEGMISNEGANDDAQIYLLDATLKVDPVKVSPFIAVMHSDGATGATSTGFGKGAIKDSTGYIGGAVANIGLGDYGVDAVFEYGSAKSKANDVTYSGYAADLAIWGKFDPVKITGFITAVSGNDGKSATKNTSFYNLTPYKIANEGRRVFILEDVGSFQNTSPSEGALGSSVRNNSNGYNIAGVSAEVVLGDLKLTPQLAYGQLNKVASGVKKDLGFEIDLGTYYTLAPGTTLFAECGYLKAGKAFGTDTKDPYMITAGTSYKL